MADFPSTPKPVSIAIDSVANPLVSVANNLRTQARDRGAHAFRFRFDYTAKTRADVAAIWAFLVKQGGRFGTFTLDIPEHAGRGTGSANVDGASQTGSSVTYDGATPSQVAFYAGDLIHFANHSKLYMVTADSTADGSGDGTVEFYPALRQSPEDNEAIDATTPTTNVRLEDNNFALDIDQCLFYGGFSVNMIESYADTTDPAPSSALLTDGSNKLLVSGSDALSWE